MYSTHFNPRLPRVNSQHKPILAANRKHRPISYTQLLPSVQAATGSQLSLRTLQRYGKEELQVKSKATKKRTAVESESSQHTDSGWVRLSELRAHSIPVMFS